MRQLVVAGGETSGACVQGLGVRQMQIGPQIDPGVPWCHAHCESAPEGLHLALKSGNFGDETFFTKAFNASTRVRNTKRMTESRARQEICRLGRSLFERGYVHGSAGNISVRMDDGFLITPTDACLGFLDPKQLAFVDLQGRQTSGERASKTLGLHTRIYRAASPFDPQTRCVIHMHSAFCVSLSMQGSREELLPALTPYFVMKVGRVPLIAYHRPGALEAADSVAEAIGRYGAGGRFGP